MSEGEGWSLGRPTLTVGQSRGLFGRPDTLWAGAGASLRDGPFPSPISYSSNSLFKTQDAAPPQPSLSLQLCCLAGPARTLALQGHRDDCASRETDPEAKAQRYPNIQAMSCGHSLKEKS